MDGVREALALETIDGKGEVARIWHEYLAYAFPKVNDKYARKIVLYLARHDPGSVPASRSAKTSGSR